MHKNTLRSRTARSMKWILRELRQVTIFIPNEAVHAIKSAKIRASVNYDTYCMKWNLHVLSKIRNWFQEVDFIRYLSTCIMFSHRQFIGCTSTFPANCNGHFQQVGIEHTFRNCWNGTFPGKIMNLNDKFNARDANRYCRSKFSSIIHRSLPFQVQFSNDAARILMLHTCE